MCTAYLGWYQMGVRQSSDNRATIQRSSGADRLVRYGRLRPTSILAVRMGCSAASGGTVSAMTVGYHCLFSSVSFVSHTFVQIGFQLPNPIANVALASSRFVYSMFDWFGWLVWFDSISLVCWSHLTGLVYFIWLDLIWFVYPLTFALTCRFNLI